MTNSPIETIRDGNLKATIWKNLGEKGNFYTVDLTRSYKDEAGNWHDSKCFSGSELLRIVRLASQAYDRTNELRQADRAALETGGPE